MSKTPLEARASSIDRARPARVLIIAGSDSSGGAGIQADIKTVTMLGGHAMTAITAITAQNTTGVSDMLPVPAEVVIAQIDSVLGDIGVDAIKIGMIGSAFTADLVARRLERIDRVPIIFDPVMVATSGASLADEVTIAAFATLMDQATLVTPNLPELARLTAESDPIEGARALAARHRCAVLVKGGHDDGDEMTDVLIDRDAVTSWQDPRIATDSTHGTGCTLASAIAVSLGQGLPLAAAVERARLFVRMALHESPGLGRGNGPLGQQAVRLDVGSGLRLNQVTVTGRDYRAMVKFYRKLGLWQIVDAPESGYGRFECGGGATFSIQIDAGAKSSDMCAIYFECDELDATVARLTRQGFSFEHEPQDQPWLWREARLRDPGGNIVFLYNAGEARRFPPWRIKAASI